MNRLSEDISQLNPLKHPTVKGIVVTGDVFRISRGETAARHSNQNGNIRWLHDLFGPAIVEVTDVPVRRIEWTSDGLGGFDSAIFYNQQGLQASEESWLHTYEKVNLENVDHLYFSDVFGDHFIIGYELSPFQKSLITKIGAIYISVSIHPVRFMADLFFQVETNSPHVRKILARHNISFMQMKAAATVLKSGARRRSSMRALTNSTLFCGQLDYDASLIKNGKMNNLISCGDGFRSLCDEYDTVYFKRHPHAFGDQDSIDFATSFSNVKLVDGNVYDLMSVEGIESVSALSSSVLFECEFFGKKPVKLLPNTLHAEAFKNSFAIGSKILKPNFWHDVLSEYVTCNPPPEGYSFDVPNPIQTSLVTSWKPKISPHERIHQMETYRYGRLISFKQGGGEPHLSTGWGEAEAWGRWASPEGGEIELLLPRPSRAGIQVTATIQVNASDENSTTVDVYAGDPHVYRERYARWIRKPITFRLSQTDIPADRILRLKLTAQNMASPRVNQGGAREGKGDSRLLGVGIVDLIAIPADGRHACELGERLTFGLSGTANDALSMGWSTLEQHGVWTTGRKASLRMRFSKSFGSDVVIRLKKYCCYINDLNPQATILFRVTENLVGRLTTREYWSYAPHDIFVSRGAIDEAGCLDLELELLNPMSPHSAGQGEDDRLLGLCLQEVEVLPAASAGWSTVNDPSAFPADQPAKDIVNVIGQMRVMTGFGVHARNVFLSLTQHLSGVTCRATNFNKSRHPEVSTQVNEYIRHDGLPTVNIFCLNAPAISDFWAENKNGYLREAYNIGYGAWELEKMPSHIADTQHINEYWAQSTFVESSASDAMRIPVRLMPLPVHAPWPKKVYSRAELGIPSDAFAFLFTFCADSTLRRKNPGAVIDAFRKAFRETNVPVALVLKTKIRQAGEQIRRDYEAFKAEVATDPRIVVIEDNMSDDALRSLYLATDAYVSLHRSEGFGLTMAEAMAYGRPVIATGYSGNTTFMTNQNSCLVEYTLIDMKHDDYHDQQQQWADPDVYQAAQYMRKLVDDEVFRRVLARKGQYHVRKHFSPEAIGRMYADRIVELRRKL